MKFSKEAIDKMGTKFKIPFREKQSIVYTTYRLSPEAHAAIKDVAQSLNLTLIDAFDSLWSFIEECEEDKTIDFSGLVGKGSKEKVSDRTRKTYAMKKETAEKLKRFAMDRKISRDVLVDTMVRFLKALIDHMSEERRKKYPRILKDLIEPFRIEAENIESRLQEEFGYDDPVRRGMGYVAIHLSNLCKQIEEFIEDGTPIDPSDI